MEWHHHGVHLLVVVLIIVFLVVVRNLKFAGYNGGNNNSLPFIEMCH
jgi:hypothetical protein